MHSVLLVDDDPVVLRMYWEALSRRGWQVELATDGLVAMKTLRETKPDLVVLDLMMPKLSGVEVLKFIRAQPDLAALPVIVLSNAYMNDLTREAEAMGTQKVLLKIECTPSILSGLLRQMLENGTGQADLSETRAVPGPGETVVGQIPGTPAPVSGAASGIPAVPTAGAAHQAEIKHRDEEFQAKAHKDLLGDASSSCALLRELFRAFANAPASDRRLRLQDLFRKVHFLTARAGLAEFHQLAQMTSVFEALLYQLMDKPERITPSVLRTIALAIDFVETLLQRARDSVPATQLKARVLVVDDDPLSNRLVVSALHQVRLQAQSTEDPAVAWQRLQEKQFELILLDIEMPGMDGFELCRRLRTLPAYKKTPVIYVTAHSDFDSRCKSALSGGDDLISKPVLPTELAVKAVMHLLKKPAPQP